MKCSLHCQHDQFQAQRKIDVSKTHKVFHTWGVSVRGRHRKGGNENKGEKTRLHHTLQAEKPDSCCTSCRSNTVTFLSALQNIEYCSLSCSITGVPDWHVNNLLCISQPNRMWRRWDNRQEKGCHYCHRMRVLEADKLHRVLPWCFTTFQSRTSGQLVTELLTPALGSTKGLGAHPCVSQCVCETEKMIRIAESKGLREMKKQRNKEFGLVWVHSNPWATCLYIP